MPKNKIEGEDESMQKIKMVQNNLNDYENYHLETNKNKYDSTKNDFPIPEDGSMIEKDIVSTKRDKNNQKENGS